MSPTDLSSKGPHLVLLPFKDKGHIAPMMILADKLQLQGLFITIICSDPESYSSIVNRKNPVDSVTDLPSRRSMLLLDTEQHGSKPAALQFTLESLKSSNSPDRYPRPAAVLVDIILMWSKQAIENCNLPRYVLYTGSCTRLASMFEIKEAPPHKTAEEDKGRLSRLDRDEDPEAGKVRDWKQDLLDSQGVLVNSAYELESKDFDLIQKQQIGKLVLPVGPLLSFDHAENGEDHDSSFFNACKQWLDEQKPGSVIYISFGSRTFLSKEQILELATGLELTKQPFLWLLPIPPRTDEDKDQYLESVLPEGFLSRKQAGMIVCDWVPQKTILAHESLGGFVTHCGWNSVLECLCLARKPMLCWPFSADQPANARLVVEELRVGWEVEKDSQGIARSLEIERKVKILREISMRGDCLEMKCRLDQVQQRLKNATEGMDNCIRSFTTAIRMLR